MANDFMNLPATAADGPGTAVDVSTLGADKTIVCKIPQQNGVASAQVLIEYSNDDASSIWAPLVQFTKPGVQSVQCAARYLRATVKNYTGAGAPTVNVGAAEATVSFAELIAPAGNGYGDAVDTSALPGFKTIQVNGTFKGVANIEVSVDAGTSWATVASFQQQGGTWSGVVYAEQMRISRSGIVARESNPGTFTCDIGAVEIGGGGGGAASVSTALGSLQGDGSAESPLGAHVFVWENGMDWADLYAAMQSVDGPKICIVQHDPTTNKMITVNADASTTDLNQIYFLGGRSQGGAFVDFEDGVILTKMATFGGRTNAYLRSKDVTWSFNCATTRLFTSASQFENFVLDIDGGALSTVGVVALGSVHLYLYNRAIANGIAAGMFQIAYDNRAICELYSGGELNNIVFSGSGGVRPFSVVWAEPSARWDANSFTDCTISATSAFAVVQQSTTGALYRLSVDGAGNVVAAAL